MRNNVSARHCCKNFKNSDFVLLTTIHKVAGKKGSDSWQESALCHLLYVITSLIKGIHLRQCYVCGRNIRYTNQDKI